MGRRRRGARESAHPAAFAILIVGGLLVLTAAGSIGVGWWMRRDHAGPAPVTRPDTPGEITVEVLGGEPGAGSAGEMAAELREAGFTVVRTGRADRRDYHGLLVVARIEPPEGLARARRVAASLGTPRVIVQRQDRPSADVTVIVGAPASR